MRRLRVLGVCLSPLALVLASGLALAAQHVQIIPEVNHGLTPALRTLPYEPTGVYMVRPWLKAPGADAPVANVEDPALQETAGPMVNTVPGLNVLGVGNGFVGPSGPFTVQYAPPDTNAAVGATQVVETVNISLAVFDKSTGTPTAGPTSINTLWTGVDLSCANGSNLSDPVVLYDQLAGRWVIEIITVSSPYKYCYAVSTSNDATGTYYAYAFTDTVGLPDYTKIGVWPDAYYHSARMFRNGSTYLGPKACAVDRSSMLTGSPATMQCFQISNSGVDGMLPSDLDGNVLPPGGSPNYFLLLPLSDSGTSTSLQLWKFHVDFTNPANSTFTGPSNITVKSYTEAGSFRGSVPQLGTANKLDGLGFSLMHRLAYRNFPTANPPHESLVVTHNVAVGPSTARRYAPRWYEIRSPGTVPVVYQQGSYSPDATYRWAGSIAMDKLGDIALGYSASSSTINPAIRYTGRFFFNPVNAMQAESTIFNGTGSQTGGLDRWGDYSSMSVDPADGCTFWYAQEYIPRNGSFNWSTRLASFKFSFCK
jgi:hypothetical protein